MNTSIDPYDAINALAAETHGGRPLIVSTFSGYGGLDLGVERATGARTVAHVEWEAAPSRILAHHWPHVPNLGDVTTVDWSRMPHGNRVIITTGFPCQDVSLAGLRRGLKDGTRSGLWSEVARAIDEIRPGLVVIENVRGLLSAEATSPVEPDAWDLGDRHDRPTLRALGAVLGDLADLGYNARWCGLRAADAGAPHGRFRVFVIAYPAGQPWRPYAPDADGSGFGVLRGFEPGERDAHGRRGTNPDGDGTEPPARLLPTPLTSDRKGAGPHGEGSPGLQTKVLDLLPTPTTSQRGTDAGAATRDGAGPNLHNAVAALLPTPTVGNITGGNATRSGDRSDELLLPGVARAVTEGTLLPTPSAHDSGSTPEAHLGRKPGRQVVTSLQIITDYDLIKTGGRLPDRDDVKIANLPGLADRGYLGDTPLLPTPSAATRNDRETPEEWQERHDRHAAKDDNPTRSGLPIEILAQSLERASSWGPYAEAIDRWERITGVPAPSPTNPDGKNGAHRLAPQFSEWMMGLPTGHVTAPEIWTGMKTSAARAAQLKAIGNGVVPQHSELATRTLIALEWAEQLGGAA